MSDEPRDPLPVEGDWPAGDSMRRLEEQVAALAEMDANVLVTGESGVGKLTFVEDVIARVAPAGRIALDCQALPPAVLARELFTEAGSGIAAPRGSVIVLREVSALALEAQARLSRAWTGAGVRLFSTTSRDLDALTRAGRFARSLLDALSQVRVEIAPLRDRPEDLLPLSRAFLREAPGGPYGLSDSAAERLAAHAFPGNVRELRSLLERAARMSGGEQVEAEHLLFGAPYAPPPSASSGALFPWPAPASGALPTPPVSSSPIAGGSTPTLPGVPAFTPSSVSAIRVAPPAPHDDPSTRD